MAFRAKTKNKLLVEERQTLDAKHNGVLSVFNENRDRIPELESQLAEIVSKLSELQAINSRNLVIDLNLQKQIWKLDDERVQLLANIENIKNSIDENKYMLNTGKILSDYYKIIEQEKQMSAFESTTSTPAPTTGFDNNNITGNNIGTGIVICTSSSGSTNNGQSMNGISQSGVSGGNKKKNIMDWFSQSDAGASAVTFENVDTGKKKFVIKKSTSSSNASVANKKNKIASSSSGIGTGTGLGTVTGTSNHNNTENKLPSTESDHTQELEGTDTHNTSSNTKKKLMNKDEIFERYMKVIDKNYINVNNDDVEVFDTCPLCHVEMLLNNNTGILICPNCGAMENIIIDSDKPSFKEPPKEMTSFCYKRINHLNEFLAQFQAKETTDIHEDVYNEILVEIKKERITNMALITPEKMRNILKKIKKNDYYEHIPYIINQLNGLPAPVIAPEIEEIIRGMFKAIQIPFEKYCPHKRKNFLSYNYVMYKFFELLELDEYLDCFQLLKSRTKLHQQDLIWKNICKDLNWQFIKSL